MVEYLLAGLPSNGVPYAIMIRLEVDTCYKIHLRILGRIYLITTSFLIKGLGIYISLPHGS